MHYKPYPYQTFCEEQILAKENVGLFLDMGLGKTVITLTALEKLRLDRFLIDKTLVITPIQTALHTWPAEIEKWGHLSLLSYQKVLGSQAARLKALEQDADIYIINPDNIVWLVQHYKAKWPFSTVVIDELSVFKSHKAKRFRALKKIRPYIKRVIGLTGTPAPNSLMDLWAEVYLLDQGERFGQRFTTFRDTYFLPDKRNGHIVYSWKLKDGAEAEIFDKIKDLCVSMKAEDYLELPDTLYIRHQPELSTKSLAEYKKLEKETFLEFDAGIIDGTTAAVLIQKLLQAAGGASYDECGNTIKLHSEKLDYFAELVEEAGSQPVLVFYTYRHELERLKERWPDAVEVKEPGAVEAWNKGEIKMLLAHPKSAGHGLNLQAGGHIIIWYSLPLSLELYQQANARLARMGQLKPVQVHHILMKGTLDSWVLDTILAPKEERQNRLLEAVKEKVQEVLA